MSDEHPRLDHALTTDKWTLGALKDYFDMRFSDFTDRIEDRFRSQEKAVEAAFKSQESATRAALVSAKEAVDKAEKLATARAEAQNEWRATVGDIIQENKGHHSGVDATVAWVIAVAAVLIGFGSLLVNLLR
jgi:hypothetical protein